VNGRYAMDLGSSSGNSSRVLD